MHPASSSRFDSDESVAPHAMPAPDTRADCIQENGHNRSPAATQSDGLGNSEPHNIPASPQQHHSGLNIRHKSFAPLVSHRQSSISAHHRKQSATISFSRVVISALKSSSLPEYDAAIASLAGSAPADNLVRYEEMMERFQVRRLTHTASAFESPMRSPELDAADTTAQDEQTPMKRSSIESVVMTRRDNNLATTSDCVPKKIAGRFSLHRTLMTWRRHLFQRACGAVEKLQTPMSPFSPTAHIRNAVTVLALAWYIVYHPLNLAFPQISTPWLRRINQLREILLLVNVLLKFNTSFQNDRSELVMVRLEIAKRYLRSWFLLDLLSSMPSEMRFRPAFIIGATSTTLHAFAVISFIMCIVRLVHEILIAHHLWFTRLNRSGGNSRIWTWLVYSRYSHLFRIAWIILFILLITHYMACTWNLLGGRQDLSQSLADAYTASFYDALQLLQGQGIQTSTTNQSIFASFAVLLGSIILAIVFGNVAVLVSNFNANSTNYQRKMEAVFAVMTKMELPIPLRERIHQYYDHLWREYESLDGEIERFSKNLSHTLELEVVLCKYMELIMGIPFWVDCTPDFQKQLMLNLHVRVYMPDDFIIRRGEVDEEFYMISRGSVELMTGPDSFERPIGSANIIDEGDKPSATGDKPSNLTRQHSAKVIGSAAPYQVHPRSSGRSMRESVFTGHLAGHDMLYPVKISVETTSVNPRNLTKGQAFGELALFMNYQRTANVRAITYVEMCVLGRKDFQRILASHPEDRKKVVSSMLSTCMINNETEGVFCPLKDMVRSVYSSVDPIRGAQISAQEAAAMIVDVINPNLEDKSIKFGVSTKLQQRLIKKRDLDRRVVGAPPPSENVSSPPKGSTIPPSCSEEGEAQPIQRLFERMEQMEHSIEVLAKMMGEMQSVLNRVASATTCDCDGQPRKIKNDSTISQRMSTDARKIQQRQQHRSEKSDDIALCSQNQQSVHKFMTIDLATHGKDESNAKIVVGHSTAIQLSSNEVSHHPLLKFRMNTFDGTRSTQADCERTAPSPTQLADQLFQTRPRTLSYRHSADSVESLPSFLSSAATTKERK